MCVGGGGGGSAPPPDFTAEKEAFRQEKLAEYQAQADAYNSQVDTFNTNLTGYNDALTGYENQVGGASLYDLYDDPTTEDINENFVGETRDTLNNFDYSTLSADYEKPTFQTSFDTEYGLVNLGELPELSSMNTVLADDLQGRANTLSSSIDDLYGQRESAVADLNQAATGLMTDYSKLNLGIDRANAFSSDLGALDSSYIDVQSGAGQLDQRLLGQEMPEYDVDQLLSDTKSSIDSLYNTRQAEYDRVSDFESGLRTQIGDQMNVLGGLNITNADEISQAQQDLRSIGQSMGGFSSQVGYDFNDELAYLNEARDQLTDLQGRRQGELDRISDFRSELVGDLRDLRDTGQSTSIYNMSDINNLQNQLADISENRSGFTSQLDYDFGNTNSYDNAIQSRIDSLINSRSDVMNDIASGVTQATSGLNDIPLYNESAMNNRLNDLQALGTNLDMFTGGRVDEIGQSMMNAQRDIQSRLNQLAAYRQTLEKEMGDYITTLRDRNYYNFDDVASARDDVATREEQVQLYRAQQAFDEIDRMEEYLNGEFRRLEADQQAVMARNQTAGTAGGASLFGAPSYTPMTLSQFNAYRSYADDEDSYSTYNPTAFSNSLGTVRL